MFRFATSLKDRGGFGLAVVILMLGLIGMVGGATVIRVQRSLQTQSQQTEALAAEDGAYSGLQASLAGFESMGDAWPGVPVLQTLPNRTEVGYRVVLNRNLSGDTTSTDPDGTVIPPKAVYAKSLGYIRGKLTSGFAAVLAQEKGVSFNYPAFGASGVNLSNSLVQAIDGTGAVQGGEAPIRTNSTNPGALTLSNGSFVDGDATVGAGGDPLIGLQSDASSGISGAAEIAGSDLTLPQFFANYDNTAPDSGSVRIMIPVPLLPTTWITHNVGVATPGTYNQLSISDPAPLPSPIHEIRIPNILFIAPGEYYCNEFSADGSTGSIIAPGDGVVIHVRDNVSWDGVLVDTSSAANFQVHHTENSGAVSLNHTSGKFLVGSSNQVDVTNSDIEGAVYGDAVNISDSTLSYPTSLDGQVLNANALGRWKAFGVRQLNPAEMAGL